MESSRLLFEGRTLTQLLCLLILGLTFQLAGITPTLIAQEADKPANPRKLVTEVPPEYPPVLKRAAIGGVVRLDVVVNSRAARWISFRSPEAILFWPKRLPAPSRSGNTSPPRPLRISASTSASIPATEAGRCRRGSPVLVPMFHRNP